MTVSARVLYAAVLRMGSVVEAIVEETAAVALDIYRMGRRKYQRLSRQKIECMGPDAYHASDLALLHRLECFGDRVADFDTALFELLRGSP